MWYNIHMTYVLTKIKTDKFFAAAAMHNEVQGVKIYYSDNVSSHIVKNSEE